MANMLIAHSNTVDDAIVEGGSWETTLPVTNLQARQIGRVARSTDLALGSTQFNLTQPRAKFSRALALVGHTMTLQAQIRVRAANVADFSTTVVDSGWIDVWSRVYPWGTLPYGAPNWYSGKYTVEDAGGYTTAFVYLLDRSIRAEFWKIEIDDQGNEDGYIQIGRMFLGDAWQPTRNMTVGAKLGWETDTTSERAVSGALYFDRKTPRRVAEFTIAQLGEDEAFGQAFEILRKMGADGEVLFVHDPDDTVRALQRRFLAHIRQMGPIEYPYPLDRSTAWVVEELL